MTSYDAERFDVESSLPVDQTLRERRIARARVVKRHVPLVAATVLLVVGSAVLALLGSRVLVSEAYGPAQSNVPAQHAVPFIVNIDR